MAARSDFVIILNNISCLPCVRSFILQSRVRASQGFLSTCSPFASPNLAPESALL